MTEPRAVELDGDRYSELLGFICKGRQDPETFLRALWNASQTADDIADGDDAPGAMALLIDQMMDALSSPFYQQNTDALRSVIATATANWLQSSRWEMAGDNHRRMYAWVWRESLDSAAIAVAYIIGGMEHATAARARIADDLYTGDQAEPFEGWKR